MGSPFHDGEREIQRRAGVRGQAEAVGRIIGDSVEPGAARFLARQRLAVASTRDAAGRPWATLLTGPAGFVRPVDAQLLAIGADPPAGDPLDANLAAHAGLGLLVLDPRTRQRMRFNGRGLRNEDGLFLLVDQAYGNCPKYIQRRREEEDAPPDAASAVRESASLDASQREWIARADTFFIASFHPEGGADASHRGGLPGFVRVTGPARLEFADYPGNAMFNTLGNLSGYPRAGLLFVDFEAGRALQLTGRTRIGRDRAVAFEIDAVRESVGATRLRYRLVEYSPANPPLSHADARGIESSGGGDDEADRMR